MQSLIRPVTDCDSSEVFPHGGAEDHDRDSSPPVGMRIADYLGRLDCEHHTNSRTCLQANEVALQPDSKIVAVGTLDATLSTDSKACTGFGSSGRPGVCDGIAVRRKIVATGFRQIYRLQGFRGGDVITGAGALDTGFCR